LHETKATKIQDTVLTEHVSTSLAVTRKQAPQSTFRIEKGVTLTAFMEYFKKKEKKVFIMMELFASRANLTRLHMHKNRPNLTRLCHVILKSCQLGTIFVLLY